VVNINQLNAEISSRYSQVIIYGAKGWLGRTSIELFINLGINPSSLLLIGSRAENLNFLNHNFQVLNPSESISQMKEGALFLNFAFLRREKTETLSGEEFVAKNLEIMNFSKSALKTKKIKTFINISSGVAALTATQPSAHEDPYAALKALDEIWLETVCNQFDVDFVNCRLYSTSGKYINEFKNLALSSFILQAFSDRVIVVNSPETKRTYVDAEDFLKVLLHLAISGGNYSLDSGGEITSMKELASVVALEIGNTSISTADPESAPNNYFGNYLEFNSVAEKYGVKLRNLKEQVAITLESIPKL
jgi:nucleoside-diphosphate-sugar epimerase